jgi:acyl carrier protein
METQELKQLLIQNCMLKVLPEEIQDDTPLFGPNSVGLDSIDALQMTLAIEKTYGIAIPNPQTAREALQSLNSLRNWLLTQTVSTKS